MTFPNKVARKRAKTGVKIASEEGSRGPEGLEPDPLTEKLAPDGAAVLEGILGKGLTDKERYLFLDKELIRRAEFKASDVLHSEKIRAEDPPFLGTQGTRVYLRRGARVVYATTGSREVQAEFLGGAIAESSLAASLGMTGAIPATAGWTWPPTFYHSPVTVDPYMCPLTIQAARLVSINPQGYGTYCFACPPGGGGGTVARLILARCKACTHPLIPRPQRCWDLIELRAFTGVYNPTHKGLFSVGAPLIIRPAHLDK